MAAPSGAGRGWECRWIWGVSGVMTGGCCGEGALSVQGEARPRVPCSMGWTGCRVPRPAEAKARGSDQCHRQAGANKSAHFGVGSFPLGSEAGGETPACSVCLCPSEPIYREHKGGELASASLASQVVLLLLLLLMFFQDFLRVLVSIGGCVRVRDTDVEDGCGATPPESVDGHIAAEFWVSASGPYPIAALTRMDQRFVRDG